MILVPLATSSLPLTYLFIFHSLVTNILGFFGYRAFVFDINTPPFLLLLLSFLLLPLVS